MPDCEARVEDTNESCSTEVFFAGWRSCGTYCDARVACGREIDGWSDCLFICRTNALIDGDQGCAELGASVRQCLAARVEREGCNVWDELESGVLADCQDEDREYLECVRL